MAFVMDGRSTRNLVVYSLICISYVCGNAKGDHSKDQNVMYMEQTHDSHERISKFDKNKDSLQKNDLDEYTAPGPTDKYKKDVNGILQQDDLDGYTTLGSTDKYNKDVNDILQQDDLDGYTTPAPSDKYNKDVNDILQQDDLDGYTTLASTDKYNKDVNGFHTDGFVNEEWGNGTNCGPGESNLTFHWHPFIIDPQGSVTFRFRFKAPVQFDHGVLTVDVGVRGQSKPVFTISMDLSCKGDIKKEWKAIQCPLQKDVQTPMLNYTENNLTRLPSGEFNVTVNIMNEKKEKFLCMNLEVEFKAEN